MPINRVILIIFHLNVYSFYLYFGACLDAAVTILESVA